MPTVHRPDGVELRWEETGSGGTVVLANQYVGSPGAYQGLIDELARDHRVVTYHLRGTGDSTGSGPYEMATDVADLGAILEAAGPADVALGLSDGCHRAVQVAAADEELVGAVVTPGFPPLGGQTLRAVGSEAEGLAASSTVLTAMLEMLESNYRAGMHSILANANPDMDEPTLRARVDEVVAFAPQDAVVARLRGWIAADSSEQARALGERLWLPLYGTNPWFGVSVADAVRQQLPEAHIEEIEDGPLNRPDLTAELVRRINA